MKHMRIALAFLLALSAVFPAASAESVSSAGLAVTVTVHEEKGPAVIPDPYESEVMHECFVRYPEFVSEDPALKPSLDQINRAILEKAHIQEYLALLPTFRAGSVGLRMDYRLTMTHVSDPGARNEEVLGRYVSILFSAEGKMLRGRPGQIYYPMTFDLLTGEEVAFDRLFSDPAGARAQIEKHLEENVEPALSAYLENNQLFPVPYDRFWLDGLNHILFVYEADQLSFLSGRAGAVSFRYCELEDDLDVSQDGVLSHLPYLFFLNHADGEIKRQCLQYALSSGLSSLSDQPCCAFGSDLLSVLRDRPLTADPGYYPGGACWEPEDPDCRGTLILSDAEGKTYLGLLTGRFEYGEMKTGYTTLENAKALIGREPDASYPMSAGDAELYLVCPGTAAEYHFDKPDGPSVLCTLYADESGVVQYIKQIIQTE